MEFIRDLIRKYWNILSYLFFGGLTTLVNYLIYFPLYYYCKLPASVSNAVAWIGAVIFAFLTNKPFVFGSHNWSKEVVLQEAGKFVGSRVFSGLVETGFIAMTVDYLKWHSLTMKVVASIGVIILNYIASRLFVFKKK